MPTPERVRILLAANALALVNHDAVAQASCKPKVRLASMFLSFLITPYSLLFLPVLFYLLPYLRSHAIRDIPGPRVAAFSNLWLLYQCRRGRRFKAVDDAHKKYGKLVRIQPNHVSIADPDAIPVIYSHGGACMLIVVSFFSEYYDAFVSIHRGLFNTRDRAEHSRKRKTVSHTFSAKSVSQFEQYITYNLQELVKQWDRLSDNAIKSGQEYAEIDSLHWFNYLAFDIIGDLIAEVKKTPTSPSTYARAVEVLNRRGEVSSTLGCLPSLKPYAAYLPDRFFRDGLQAVEDLAGIAVARVNERLASSASSERVDLLARLMEGKDENGEKLGRDELTAEALTQLIAGSDTTSNTSCALLYWVLRTPHVLPKLQRELDEALPQGCVVPDFESVRDLP
ncbi:MAG: hypothetical protein Q9195_008485 [Heterodermia aff. obscurata]